MKTTPCRWFRVSLSGMLVFTTAIACWLGWNVYAVGQRKAALAELRAAGDVEVWTAAELQYDVPTVGPQRASVSRLREQLGDQAVHSIEFSSRADKPRLERAAQIFPEAYVSWRNEADIGDTPAH